MSKKTSLDIKNLNGDDELSEKDKQKLLLYNKKVVCPVCDNNFNARAIKKSSYRILKKDSDFFIRYSIINPYFYDVWVCDECGYAAMKNDFEHLNDYDADIIREKISPKWKSKNYPDVYDIDLAITRYKLSLLNYYTINAKSSKKGMNSLKIAWMYRIKEDKEKEIKFLNQALKNFQDAYYDEPSPIYGMDKFTTMYLIGELLRRTGKGEDSLIWFSQVITSTMASQKIKNLARDQKDLIKDTTKTENTKTENNSEDNKKHGLFFKFHK